MRRELNGIRPARKLIFTGSSLARRAIFGRCVSAGERGFRRWTASRPRFYTGGRVVQGLSAMQEKVEGLSGMPLALAVYGASGLRYYPVEVLGQTALKCRVRLTWETFQGIHTPGRPTIGAFRESFLVPKSAVWRVPAFKLSRDYYGGQVERYGRIDAQPPDDEDCPQVMDVAPFADPAASRRGTG